MSHALFQPISRKTKSALAVESIEGVARSLGGGAKLPTFQELRQNLGISATTLNLALAELESRNVISRRQGSGIYVSDRILEKRVALVVGQNIFNAKNSPFFSMLLKGCEKRATEGYERFSFFLDTPEFCGSAPGHVLHRDIEEVLAQGKMDGILLAQKRGREQEECLRSYGIPVVAFTQGAFGPGCVSVDRAQIIDLCVKTLSEQGCKSIGFFSPIYLDRALFYESAKQQGVQISEPWIITPEAESPITHDAHEMYGRKSAEVFLAQSGGKAGMPDGLVLSDDVMARGVCLTLAQHGIKFGKDIKIASHANKGSAILAEWKNQLVLAEIDPQEIVEAMFSILEGLMIDPAAIECSAQIQAHLVYKSQSSCCSKE